jgi:hypothetical protein
MLVWNSLVGVKSTAAGSSCHHNPSLLYTILDIRWIAIPYDNAANRFLCAIIIVHLELQCKTRYTHHSHLEQNSSKRPHTKACCGKKRWSTCKLTSPHLLKAIASLKESVDTKMVTLIQSLGHHKSNVKIKCTVNKSMKKWKATIVGMGHWALIVLVIMTLVTFTISRTSATIARCSLHFDEEVVILTTAQENEI